MIINHNNLNNPNKFNLYSKTRKQDISFGKKSDSGKKKEEDTKDFNLTDHYFRDLNKLNRLNKRELYKYGRRVNEGREAQNIIKGVQCLELLKRLEADKSNKSEIQKLDKILSESNFEESAKELAYNFIKGKKAQEALKEIIPDKHKYIFKMINDGITVAHLREEISKINKLSELLNNSPVKELEIIQELKEKNRIERNRTNVKYINVMLSLISFIRKGYKSDEFIKETRDKISDGRISKENIDMLKNGEIPLNLQNKIYIANAAKKTIVERLQPLVIHVVKKFRRFDFLSVLQTANEGLMKVVERFEFDLDRPTFISYAITALERIISNKIGELSNDMQLPKGIAIDINKLRRVDIKYAVLFNKKPTVEEYSKETELSARRIKKLQEIIIMMPSSHSRKMNEQDKDSSDIISQISDSKSNAVRNNLEDREFSEYIRELIKAGLSLQEARVLELRFGFDPEYPGGLSCAKISEIGIIDEVGNKKTASKTTIFEIEKNAIKKLHKGMKQLVAIEQIPESQKTRIHETIDRLLENNKLTQEQIEIVYSRLGINNGYGIETSFENMNIGKDPEYREKSYKKAIKILTRHKVPEEELLKIKDLSGFNKLKELSQIRRNKVEFNNVSESKPTQKSEEPVTTISNYIESLSSYKEQLHEFGSDYWNNIQFIDLFTDEEETEYSKIAYAGRKAKSDINDIRVVNIIKKINRNTSNSSNIEKLKEELSETELDNRSRQLLIDYYNAEAAENIFKTHLPEKAYKIINLSKKNFNKKGIIKEIIGDGRSRDFILSPDIYKEELVQDLLNNKFKGTYPMKYTPVIEEMLSMIKKGWTATKAVEEIKDKIKNDKIPSSYCKSIKYGKIPFELEEDIRKGEIARKILIKHKLRFALSKAMKYSFLVNRDDFNGSISDLIQAANQGLVYAVDNYDHTRGANFTTYASKCIDNELIEQIKCLYKKGRLPRILPEIIKFDKEFVPQENRPPTAEEISKITGHSLEKVNNALEYQHRALISLSDSPDEILGQNVEFEDENIESILEIIKNDNAQTPQEKIKQNEISDTVNLLLKCGLTKREGYILRLRYGLHPDFPKSLTMDEIAKKYYIADEKYLDDNGNFTENVQFKPVDPNSVKYVEQTALKKLKSKMLKLAENEKIPEHEKERIRYKLLYLLSDRSKSKDKRVKKFTQEHMNILDLKLGLSNKFGNTMEYKEIEEELGTEKVPTKCRAAFNILKKHGITEKDLLKIQDLSGYKKLLSLFENRDYRESSVRKAKKRYVSS